MEVKSGIKMALAVKDISKDAFFDQEDVQPSNRKETSVNDGWEL